MTAQKPAWIETALEAAAQAVRTVDVEPENHEYLAGSCKIAHAALSAFIQHVPEAQNLYRDRRDVENAKTLRLLKSHFTQDPDA